MIPVHKALSSSVGKKFLMALSGLMLVLFVIIHLLGNLTLYQSDGSAFNLYASTLESLGKILIVAECGLLGAFGLHILMGFTVTLGNKSARPTRYRLVTSKGGPSLSNAASRNMIITGALLFVFLVFHIWQFKFGPGNAEGYVATVRGHEVRDLFRLVKETFKNPLFVGIYVAAMAMLGTHLRHGFWSAFQSLGAMNAAWMKPVRILGMAIAFLLAWGFLLIPIWIFIK